MCGCVCLGCVCLHTQASRKDDRDDNNDVDEEQLMTLLVSKRQASKSIAFSVR